MAKLLGIFVLCMCVTAGLCAVAMEMRNPNAGPHSCISNTYNLHMNAGEAISVPGMCMQAMCKDNGDIVYYSCGVVGVPPGHKLLPGDLSLPYPQCCSTKIVPE